MTFSILPNIQSTLGVSPRRQLCNRLQTQLAQHTYFVSSQTLTHGMSSKTRSPTILCNGTTYNRTEKSECDLPTPAPTYPAPTLSNSRSRLSDPGSQLSHSSSQLTDSSTYLSDSFRLRVLPLRLQFPTFRFQEQPLRLSDSCSYPSDSGAQCANPPRLRPPSSYQ